MKNKKILIACLVVIILASVITIIYMLTNNKEETPDSKIEDFETVQNDSILNDATVENLKITNVSLLTRDGISSFKAQVLNETSESINIDKLYVVFYENETENKILVLSDITIPANDKTYINMTSESDLSKTTKIEYVLED